MLLFQGMKPLRPILLAITAVAALSVAYPAKANLITNPGFETGDFTGWTGINNAGVGGTNFGIAPHSGSFQTNFGTPSGISQSVATTAGQSYTISFFYAVAGVIPPNFTLSVNWGGSTVFSHLFTSASGYTEFTTTVTASASSTTLAFATSGLGFSFLDDVSVEVAGVPDGGTTVSLLGCALLGLAALRRKLGC